MATAAEHLIRRMRDVGVRMLFGVPGGGGNLDLIAAAERGGMPFVLTSTETGGAIAAIAQAEITGAAGACLTTLGPGVASVMNGVACAHLERSPIFVITDNYASTDQDRYEHQRINHKALMERITSQSFTLAPGSAFASIEQACYHVAPERSSLGPVHLDCPADFNQAVEPANYLVGDVTAAPPSAKNEELLRQSRRPLALIGLGARHGDAAARIRRLCESKGLPAMVTYKAKGVVPDMHPWFAGVFTNGTIEKPLINESDLIIGIGLDEVELLPRPWQPRSYIPYGRAPRSAVLDGIQQVETCLQQSDWHATEIHGFHHAQLGQIMIHAAGFTAQHAVQVTAAKLARDSRVTVDAGAHMFPATMLWPVSEPNQMLISNGLSTMGFALPAAIGAALLERDRTVVALTGDGGLLMCMGELATAVREQLKIIVIVFNDASLSLIEIKQQARKLAPAGVALGAMDWAAIARGFGAAGFSAHDDSTLDRALDDAIAAGGPAVIDVKIDRSNYGATMKAIRG
jgi:acetolactate synthase-1/2/3 large subunit